MKKIFIAQCASLGDTLLSTPLIRAVKNKYPAARILMMASPAGKDILNGNPYIDELLFYTRGDNLLPIVKKVWRSDAALIVDYHYRSSLIAWLARIPQRIGRGSKKNRLLTRQLPAGADYQTYEAEQTLALAEAIGVKADDTSLVLPACSADEEKRVKRMLGTAGLNVEDEQFVTIAPYSLSPLKDWPADYYQNIIDFLTANHRRVVLIGGRGDRSKAERFTNCLNLLGETNIRETALAISWSSLLICGCTFVLHVASTTATPVIALYGPTSPAQWAPRKNCEVVYENYSCSPCYNTGRTCTSFQECLKAIKPEKVKDIIARKLF